MTDVHSPEVRNYIMSRIRAKDTKPELLVKKFLFSQKFKYRLYDNQLSGKPDIILPKYRTSIFVHGCFWHGHKDCKHYTMPKTNVAYWKPKIEKNIERDRKKQKELAKDGWNVIVIWECELRPFSINITLKSLVDEISK